MASVEKHGKKFRGTYTDENGRRRKTRVFPTKRAARQCAEEQEARLRSGTWRDPSTGKRTLTEYVEDPDHGWLRLRREERTTRDGYRSHWNQIKPVLEHYELRRLRSSVIQAWVKRTGSSRGHSHHDQGAVYLPSDRLGRQVWGERNS